MVKHLQEELIAVRLREAETAGTIRELRQKIAELEDVRDEALSVVSKWRKMPQCFGSFYFTGVFLLLEDFCRLDAMRRSFRYT